MLQWLLGLGILGYGVFLFDWETGTERVDFGPLKPFRDFIQRAANSIWYNNTTERNREFIEEAERRVELEELSRGRSAPPTT